MSAWRGEASDPVELAREIGEVPSKVFQQMEVVTFTVSAENRDLIVRALQALPAPPTIGDRHG